jgi:anti-sigma regulatory factor (Ser/Thr protein kinase)
MTEAGRNPARIIPELRAFIEEHPGRPVSYVGEPAWPARSPAEWREVTRHDALINLAFSGATITILCPYDRMTLPPSVIADARITHPVVLQQGRPRPSPEYYGKDGMPPGCELPLPAPPAWADSLVYTMDLRAARRLVRRHAAQAGFAEVAPDLVLAVGEIASNTLRHTDGGGTLHVWHSEQEILCQLHDQGQIADPLAGRVRHPPDAAGGHGLWLVNQVCDLVELRTGQQGTTIRLHMRRPS